MSSVSDYPIGKLDGTLSIHGGGISVQGVRRDNNEDLCAVDPNGRFFILADGIGGSHGGEVASRIACDVLTDELTGMVTRYEADVYAEGGVETSAEKQLEIQAELLAAVKSANDAIMVERRRQHGCCEMGCTAVAAVVAYDRIYLASIGDSRAYLLRDGDSEQLTRDHTLTAGLVDMGLLNPEEAAVHPYRNTLYKCLGGWSDSDPADIQIVTVLPGDCMVLATDGVTDCVPEAQIAAVCAGFTDPQHASAQLIDAAMENGAGDDMTCIVIYISRDYSGNEQ